MYVKETLAPISTHGFNWHPRLVGLDLYS